MRRLQNLGAAALLGLALPALAGEAHWLIATPSESVQAGAPLTLEAIRPDNRPWPDTLKLLLSTGPGQNSTLLLQAAEDGDPAAPRRTYRATLPSESRGLIRAELAEHPSNRLALLAEGVRQAAQEAPADPIDQMSHSTTARLDPIPANEPALSAHEPMYFVLGGRDGADARFQLSFKYRLFDRESLPARLLPLLGSMHFGYTQTSLWDLHGDSKPFRDTSYRPSLFWQGSLDTHHPLLPSYWRAGYEHESNGKEGSASRSIDTLFAQPVWRQDFNDGRSLIVAPKFYGYLDKDENPDIARYRGYADWIIRYGHERGWMLGARLRQGTGGYASGELNLSVPLREPLFSRTGGFLHFQLFSGYGESLLDYNVRQDPTLRIGFSIVR